MKGIESNFGRVNFRTVGSPEWIGLLVLGLFTLTAILGYAVFALNPGLIPDSEGARRFYAASFPLFARVHILLAALVLLVPLVRRAGWAWAPAFLAILVVSFLSEFVGTGYGIPFGGYSYTGLLGFRLGGRVPAVIPLSWFLMALPSWVVANAAFPGGGRLIGRLLLGAYLLTAWDLALDPAMSYLTPYWVWTEPGSFYGMPWMNLVGWMGTGVLLMGLLELLGGRRWGARLPVGWMVTFYAIVVLMPLGMLVAAGLWGAVWATLAAVSLPLALRIAVRGQGARVPDPGLTRGSVPS